MRTQTHRHLYPRSSNCMRVPWNLGPTPIRREIQERLGNPGITGPLSLWYLKWGLDNIWYNYWDRDYSNITIAFSFVGRNLMGFLMSANFQFWHHQRTSLVGSVRRRPGSTGDAAVTRQEVAGQPRWSQHTCGPDWDSSHHTELRSKLVPWLWL